MLKCSSTDNDTVGLHNLLKYGRHPIKNGDINRLVEHHNNVILNF